VTASRREEAEMLNPSSLLIEALQAVEKFAGRLLVGDVEGDVRRSVEELRTSFATNAAVEPAVNRLLRSLRGLHSAGLAGRRRDFQRDSLSVGRLLEAVEQELLPALRRLGFQV